MVLSGGTGVIGRAALPALLAAGHEVAVLSRSLPNHEFARSHGAEAVAGDLLDLESLKAAYAGADAVVNLATQIPVAHSSSASSSCCWTMRRRRRIPSHEPVR